MAEQQSGVRKSAVCQIPLANAATALAAVEQLPFDISVETIKRSLIEVELVGRFQQIER